MEQRSVTLLAVESSAGPASCAVLCRENGTEQIVCTASVNNRLTHSQTLMPMIHDMLKNAGMSLADISHLAVAVGPGSFTGVRIGVAAVKGLSFPNDLPCAAVSTLAGMARRFEGLPYTGLILTAMDARCQQVYTALFSSENGVIVRETSDEALPIEKVKTRLASETRPIVVVGDGAELCYSALEDVAPSVTLAPVGLRYQHAVGIAREAICMVDNGTLVSGEELLPAYLRLPQAERELRAKQGQASKNDVKYNMEGTLC